MRGEGRGKTECHFLLTNSPRRLFFIPPLLLVIAQSSRIHLTGHFTNSSTAILSHLFSVFQVQHYYWYFNQRLSCLQPSSSTSLRGNPHASALFTSQGWLWEGDLCQVSSGKTERQTTGLTMTWGRETFADINSAVRCHVKRRHLSVPWKHRRLSAEY